MASELVLVTGGSGFVGSWCILYALQRGYRVRTTVRSLKRADEVREMITNGGISKDKVNGIEFVATDLTKDDGWAAACKDCTYVLHVASPFPAGAPKHENDLIIPARDGTLRVLKAADAAGSVKRVVVTSSIAAVQYGHPDRPRPFTEESWSNLENPKNKVPAYMKSKTIAERAAWSYVQKEAKTIELAVINPAGILGPVLSKSAGTSVSIIARALNGKLPVLPKLYGTWTDVRDIAELHLLAMTNPAAKGQRFISCAGGAWFREVAQTLKDNLGDRASKVSTTELPNFVVKLAAYVDPTAALISGTVGDKKDLSSEKAKRVLGFTHRSVEEAIMSCANSCLKYDVVPV